MEKKLLCISWVPIEPAHTGGSVRIKNILINLRQYDVNLVSPYPPSKSIKTYHFNINWLRFLPAPFNPFILTFFIPHIMLKTVLLIIKIKPDIIQYESLWPFLPLNLFIPKKYKKNSILVVHNLESVAHSGIASKVLSVLERLAYRKSHLLVAMSKEDKEKLIRLFNCKESQIIVAPNGINIHAKSKYKVVKTDKTKKILFMGKLDYFANKEALHFIEHKLINKLHKEIKNVSMIVVGHPIPKNRNTNVVYTGFVDDVFPYIEKTDICIAPIFSGSGSRLKILEYLSAGKPVISTLLGVEGLNLEPGKHFFKAENENEFITVIKNLLQNPSRAKIVAQSGQAFVNENYSWEKIVKEYEEILKKLP